VDDDDEPAPPVQAQPVFMMNDQNFVQWAFGVQDLDKVRSRLESYLTLKVQEIDRVCGPNSARKQKLSLAGRTDIKRIWDRVEAKRRKYVNIAHEQNKINEIIQDVQSLRALTNGDPFADGTLFAKTVKATLSADEAALYAEAVEARRQYRYRAKADAVVASLDQAIGFTDKQREQLLGVILRETRPPRQFGQYDFQMLLFQLAKVPEERLKGIFDDLQWRVLSGRLEQARASEPTLIRLGVLPGNENPPAPRAAAPVIRRTFNGR
jgi:hypothetical protein